MFTREVFTTCVCGVTRLRTIFVRLVYGKPDTPAGVTLKTCNPEFSDAANLTGSHRAGGGVGLQAARE